MTCSVCIATYKRPELLEDLLRSLVNQVLTAEVTMEILVVDNDSEGSAERIVHKFHDTMQTSFRYFRQPIKNISLTRNMAVANATGEYILFIDDDEVACQEWVVRLLGTLREFDADGVFGPVIPNFNDAAPEWMKRSHLFDRPSSVTTTGTEAKATGTGNCILKASLLKGMDSPFDPEYGLTGGEDTYLFDRLRRSGAKFVYCNGAWVSEYWPPSRTRVSYLVKRALRTGGIHTKQIIQATGRRKLFIRLFMLLKAICFGSISLALVIALFPNKIWRTHWQMKLASNLGRFLAVFGWYGWYYQEYR